jgi:hypothetical protein
MNKKGFTMVEIMVAAMLTVITITATWTLYTTHHQFYNIASIFTELRGYTKNFKTQVSKDIEEARSVVSSQSLLGTTYTTGSGELVLKCYATTATGFDTSKYDYIAYRTSGGKIWRVVDADSASLRGDSQREFISHVYSLSFNYYDHNETELTSDYANTTRIRMSLDVRKTWAGKERSETMAASARLRNKR